MEGERTASSGDSTESEPAAGVLPEATRYVPGALDPTAEDRTAAGQVVHKAAAPPLPTVDASVYELSGEHARGGLGRILRARDRRLGRPVAVKELLRDSESAAARFVREAEITARLQHPGIVPIYEAGLWPNGKPFYAMRMVAGRPLSEVIAACRDLGERLALLPNIIAIAETMAYAHGQHVIHRDLKPANVLVGDYGETVVIDWGLAKDLDAPGGADLLSSRDPSAADGSGGGIGGRGGGGGALAMTIAGTVLGTPAYMPPEQARGQQVDARADVYALGAILYHLLAGDAPYRSVSGNVVAAVAAAPPPALPLLQPGLPADLLAIVAKAMARNPAERYPTAAELAIDLKRYTTGQLVSAHRYTAGTLVRRWLSRHRTLVAVAAAVLLASAIAGTIAIINIVAARDTARTQQHLAATRADELAVQRNQLLLQQATSALDRDPTETLTGLARYPEDGPDWPQVRSLAAEAVSRGVARFVFPGNYAEAMSAAFSADGHRLVMCSSGLVQIRDATTGSLLGRYEQPDARYVAISSDGRTVASTSAADPQIWLWSEGNNVPRLLAGHADLLFTLGFVDGDRALVTSSRDGTVRRWDLVTGTSTLIADPAPKLSFAVASPDGRFIAGADGVGGIRIWNVAAARQRLVATRPGEVTAMAVDRDGQRIAAAIDHDIWVWVDGGPARLLGQVEDVVTELGFLGDSLVAAGLDRAVRVWPLGGDPPINLLGHQQGVHALAISRIGCIATGDQGGDVRLWCPMLNRAAYQTSELKGHRGDVHAIAFSPDGSRVVTSSSDRTTRVWDVNPRGRVVQSSHTGLFQLAYVDGGRSIVATRRDGMVERWDLASGDRTLLGQHAAEAYPVQASLDGRAVVTGGWDGTVIWWDLAHGTSRTLRAAGQRVWSLDLSRDGAWLAISSDDGAELVQVSTGERRSLVGHRGTVYNAAFSPDGSLLATVGADLSVRLWTIPDGEPGAVLRGHTEIPTEPTFTKDGHTLITGSWDGTVRLWDLPEGTSRVLRGHDAAIRALALSPSGRLLATGSYDDTVRIWDLQSGVSQTLRGHTAEVRSLAFSPDGALLASASWDHTVRMWDLETGSSQPLVGPRDRVHRVAFRPDGEELAAVAADGTLWLWPVALAREVPTDGTALRRWLHDRAAMAR
jgi:eukaryotic-like serine/threonine-protein kinase